MHWCPQPCYEGSIILFSKLFFFFKFFIIVDLQCSVISCCTVKWPSIHIYTFFFSHFLPSWSITSGEIAFLELYSNSVLTTNLQRKKMSAWKHGTSQRSCKEKAPRLKSPLRPWAPQWTYTEFIPTGNMRQDIPTPRVRLGWNQQLPERRSLPAPTVPRARHPLSLIPLCFPAGDAFVMFNLYPLIIQWLHH